MAKKTDTQLQAQAATIRDETSTGANTATRVGEMNLDTVDSKERITQQSTIAVNANAIDIDLDGEKDFVSNNRLDVSTNVNITLSNATNARSIIFSLEISNLATITFPSGTISGDVRVVSEVFTPSVNGKYTFVLIIKGSEYDLFIQQLPSI